MIAEMDTICSIAYLRPLQRCIQAIWETSILVWVPKLWHPKKTFQVYFFLVVFQQEIC